MTAIEMYDAVVKSSDITLYEVPDDNLLIRRCIQLGLTETLLYHLQYGNLHAGQKTYTVAEDSILYSPDPSISLGLLPSYPLAIRGAELIFFVTSSSGLETVSRSVRLSYLRPHEFWSNTSRNRRGVTEEFAWTFINLNTYFTMPNDIYNVYPLPAYSNIKYRIIYWREPQYNRIQNIIDIPEEYHGEVVERAIKYVSSSLSLVPSSSVAASGQIPIIGDSVKVPHVEEAKN